MQKKKKKLSSWAMAKTRRPSSLRVDSGSIRASWNPPPLGSLKCNIDAAFFESINLSGFGMCIRDHGGILSRLKQCGLTLIWK